MATRSIHIARAGLLDTTFTLLCNDRGTNVSISCIFIFIFFHFPAVKFLKGFDPQKLFSIRFVDLKSKQSDRNTVFGLCIQTGIEQKGSCLIDKGDFVVARFILEKNH